MNNLPTTEERVWAVLAHLSALALGMGIVLPVVGWSEQRRKSNYASFQCLQALGYQSLGYTIWLLAYLILIMILMVILIVFAASSGNGPSGTAPQFEAGFILVMVIMIGALGIYFLLPIVAAVFCALGRDFHYPIMGKRLSRYVGYEFEQTNHEQGWLIEDHEDRWVVAMGHFSVVIALWGMLIPLTAWILQGKRSLFLKFQSMQTLVFQGVMTLFSFLPLGIMLIAFAGFGVLAGFENRSTMNTSSSLLILFVIMILATILVLVVPLFQALGQWAGYRVLKGDDYRYPLVGKLVEKYGVSQLAGGKREQAPRVQNMY